MNYNLKSEDLLKENWVKVDFMPVYDEKWTKFVEDYMETEIEYCMEDYDFHDYETILKENNRDTFLINKESLGMLNEFIKDMGVELFGYDNIEWKVCNEVNNDTLMGWGVFIYGDNGWESVQNNIKEMVI